MGRAVVLTVVAGLLAVAGGPPPPPASTAGGDAGASAPAGPHPRSRRPPPPVQRPYRPPVPGPVIDPFRPPATPWGPGNRGLDLAARPGEAVRAAAGGTVTFAGQVGGVLYVVVLHPDGVRTTYGRLATVTVGAGETVRSGDTVGTAAGPVHFGARLGDRYLDPALLLGPHRIVAVLVPGR